MPTARRKKTAVKRAPVRKASSTNPLMKSFLDKEQAAFMAKHKNMNALLLAFMVFVTLFFVVVYLNKAYYMM